MSFLITAQSSKAALTIHEFSRDQTVFDSGAQLGKDGATIPLSGTAQVADGTPVEVRIVAAEDGKEIRPWQPVATVSNGTWSGKLTNVPRSTHWLKVEVRAEGAGTATMTNRFGVGIVWAIYEQSNWARLFSPAFSKTKPDPVTHPDDVQVFTVKRPNGAASRTLISDTTPLSAAVVALANAFTAERPGEKLAIAAHVQSGSSPVDMIEAPESGGNKRHWADEVTLHQAVTADGSPVGIVTDNGWIAFDGGTPGNEDTVVPIVTQKLADGTPVDLGDDLSKVSGPGFTLAHALTELYDWSYSRFTFVGPHGRANSATSPGSETPGDLAYMKMVDQWRAVLTHPNFPEFLPLGFETHGAIRGVKKGKAGWTDTAHHSATDKDGLERLAQIGVASMLKAADLVKWPRPVFDRVHWAPDGSYVDYWMDGYNMTTERVRRGLPPIPATFPHRTEVMGFSVDGKLAHEAVLVPDAGGSGFAGVRVSPITGKFTPTSSVQYGRGKQPGFQQFPEDYQDGYHLNLPVVDVGQSAMPALPVGVRSTETLPNTLPGGK